MAILKTREDLQAWESYRAFLKMQLKLLAEEDQPVYVSKEKLEFEILGKPWAGHAVLAGPKATLVVQSLRKEGVLFREGTCRPEGKLLFVAGLKPKLRKEMSKTFLKLKLGYKVALDGGDDEGADDSEDPTGTAAAGADGQEAAWRKLKAAMTPRIRSGLASGAPEVDRIQSLLSEAVAREKANDYAGAIAVFKDVAPLLASAAAASKAGKDPVDQLIDDAIGDPQKRLEALAKWKVPRYSDEYKDDTPEIRFLKDMESGTKKATEYVDYIKQGLDYYEKYGELAGLGRAGDAAKGLKKITGQLSGGLKKVGKVIEGVKNVAVWLVALDAFADASKEMQPTDRQSVVRWVDALGRLYDATAPFLEWAQGKAVTAAFAGSSAAGALGATLPIVTAQFYVGLKTLQQGVKNVDAYMSRLEKWQRIADEAERGRPTPPPPPAYPGEWKTREEEARDALARENEELRRRIEADHRSKVEAAVEEFDTKLFPDVYLARRGEIKRKILEAMRKAGSTTYQPGDVLESDWWECLMSSGGDSVMDEQAGVYVTPKKDSVTRAEALQEIVEFQGLSKPCPYFQELYERARRAHLQKAVPVR